MSQPGPNFYDDDCIFATYMARRQNPDNPNDTLEKPILLELIREVAGLRILDLGCGDATFGRAVLERGCRAYRGDIQPAQADSALPFYGCGKRGIIFSRP